MFTDNYETLQANSMGFTTQELDMTLMGQICESDSPVIEVKALPSKSQLRFQAYDKAIKKCTLKNGPTKVQFWTVEGGYSPFTITNGKKQYFKTVDSMRKRYIMLIKQGYTLVK